MVLDFNTPDPFFFFFALEPRPLNQKVKPRPLRPLLLNTLFLGPDRLYFGKLLLVLRPEIGFNYVLSMRNRLLT